MTALEADVLAGAGSGAAGAAGPAGGSGGSGAGSVAQQRSAHPEVRPAEPVDLVGTAGASVLKRVGPVVALLVVVGWLLRPR